MPKPYLIEWFKLTEENRKNIFTEVSSKMELRPSAVEKDWWVVQTLDIVFSMKCAQHLIFKGGTSLSKVWKLINRFSEDIDLAIDRKYFCLDGDITGSKVRKLRKESNKYISGDFLTELNYKFKEEGFKNITAKTTDVTDSDQDPLIIIIEYKELTEKAEYINPNVILEIGSRSLVEPNTKMPIISFVGEIFNNKIFADKSIEIPTVNPERTFLEKIFLLHEEFQKPSDKIKSERMSRHLYDIFKLKDAGVREKALNDMRLYKTIVEHRKKFTPIRRIDYSLHAPDKINFIPPNNLLKDYEKDYKEMVESMIYEETITFEKLIYELKLFNKELNALKF